MSATGERQLEDLQKAEGEAKGAWLAAVRASNEAQNYAKLMADRHSEAQRAVIEELRRLVGESQ